MEVDIDGHLDEMTQLKKKVKELHGHIQFYDGEIMPQLR